MGGVPLDRLAQECGVADDLVDETESLGVKPDHHDADDDKCGRRGHNRQFDAQASAPPEVGAANRCVFLRLGDRPTPPLPRISPAF